MVFQAIISILKLFLEMAKVERWRARKHDPCKRPAGAALLEHWAHDANCVKQLKSKKTMDIQSTMEENRFRICTHGKGGTHDTVLDC